MDNRMLNTLQCFKGLCNDVFSCLRQNLNGDIIRNEILFLAAKLGCRTD